jgi:tyrosyl-tRNA synthetase
MDMEAQLAFLAARSVDLISADDLRRKLKHATAENRPLRIKMGADPSAPDLHLGHTVGLNKLREFQELGHTVVFIIGDFTGMIGDPSGKSATRPALSKADVQRNAETYKDQIFKILDPARTELRYNSEWFGEMKFDEVIRISAHVTVAQMLARDDFSARYKEQRPISLVEFLYPLVQAYDSVMVRADLELGGTDQLFNLLLGRELQKVYGQEPQVVMTLPLIEGLDGTQKMSKSLNNYVGVTEPPNEQFGKLMSVNDELMWKYFAYILCLPTEEIETLRAGTANGSLHPREVKDRLAREVVTRFHGPEAARSASDEFKKVFSERGRPSDIPEFQIPPESLTEGQIGILTLITAAGLASSNAEARRNVEQGGVSLDDEKISDPRTRIEPADGAVLKVGKRRFARLRL